MSVADGLFYTRQPGGKSLTSVDVDLNARIMPKGIAP
jgi:hypothetical protein